MPRLDIATRNIAIGRLKAGESQNAGFIMFTGAQFQDFGNGTSNPVPRMTVNALADLRLLQQHKIDTSGYFT